MNKIQFFTLLIAGILVHVTGLLSDIFLVDSSLYAIISKQMSISGDYVNLYVNGQDWLDKPHFPFWVCALSMDVFGINTFAYKLPSLLFFFLGVWYTYRLARQLYDDQTARVAVLIMLSALHLIISNNDVRAESIMIGVIMGAVYHMYQLTDSNSWKHLIPAALFTAAAIMTKGIFVLLMIYPAIGFPMILAHGYKSILKLRWLLLFLLTALFTLPEIYAVYQQFDLHPEKTVFGRQGVSGVRFLLWDSQFGRFFNTGPIQGKGDPFFFLHTMLWAFAPWAIIGYWAVWNRANALVRKDLTLEYVTYFGVIFLFLLFSLSRFQLPHYTNILFPLLAILLAGVLREGMKSSWVRKLATYSLHTYAVGSLLTILLLTCFSGLGNMWLTGLVVIGLIGVITYFLKNKHQYIAYGCSLGLLLGVFLNLSFYPDLLRYQSGPQITQHINQELPGWKLSTSYDDFLLQYYYDGLLNPAETFDINNWQAVELLVCKADVFRALDEQFVPYRIIEEFKHFHISQLNLKFLNHKTRKATLEPRWLIMIGDASDDL